MNVTMKQRGTFLLALGVAALGMTAVNAVFPGAGTIMAVSVLLLWLVTADNVRDWLVKATNDFTNGIARNV